MDKKENFNIGTICVIISVVFALVTLGIIIFRTDIGNRIIKWLEWLYHGLEDFNFNN